MLDINTLPLLYKTLVRPISKYVNVMRGPYYATNQKLLEKVKGRDTKLVNYNCQAFITFAIAIILLYKVI